MSKEDLLRNLLMLVALALAYTLFPQGGSAPAPAMAEKAQRHTARVQKVLDGDTLIVNLNGTTEHVRLLGIDTPESKYNQRAELQAKRSAKDMQTILALGKRAAEFTNSLAPKNSNVQLEFDLERRDRYDRLLAYVYLPDGRMLNEELLKAGHAALLTYAPNLRYVKRFIAAQQVGVAAARKPSLAR